MGKVTIRRFEEKDVPNKVAEHKQPTPKKKKSKERG